MSPAGTPNTFALVLYITSTASIMFLLWYSSFITVPLFPSNLSARVPNESTEASIMARRRIPLFDGSVWSMRAHGGIHLSCTPHETPRRGNPIILELQDPVWNPSETGFGCSIYRELYVGKEAVFRWIWSCWAHHVRFCVGLNMIYCWTYC